MSIIEQIKQRFNNNQLETEKLKLQLSNIKSTLVSIKVVKQICDIDLDQLELISEYVTKAKVDLPTGIIDWRSYLDTVSINMYKERKQLMGSVDDEWMIWLYNKSERIGDFIKPDSIEEPDNGRKRKQRKNKGGRKKGSSPNMIARVMWIRDKYQILKDKDSGENVKERAELIASEMRKLQSEEKLPDFFEGSVLKHTTVYKYIKTKRWKSITPKE